jgi:membrane-associated phospholipid phosphatase
VTDTPGGVPGRAAFGPAVDAFDAAADELLEQLRDHPLADRLFLTASHLGDFSLIWHLVSLVRGVARRRPDQAIVLAAALGLESLIVNQGVKRLFPRTRPTWSGDTRLQVRRPSTSAFPSGHASAAAFAAATLIAWDGRRWAPLWISLAAIVGVSRAYVKIHHPSDVIGGAVTGLALAALLRPAIQHFAPVDNRG